MSTSARIFWSDAELLGQLQAALRQQLRGTARRIQVHVDQGLVTLSGTVATYFDRQLACEASRRISGVRGVQDELQVIREVPVPIPLSPLARTWQEMSALRVVTTSVILALATMCTGCGEKVTRLPVHPVRGQITRNGQPLAHALVAFHPRSATPQADLAPRGQTDEQGRFTLTTYDSHDGAPAGEYAVTVQYYQPIQNGSSSEPGPNVLSPKLALPSTTDIVVQVTSGTNELPAIEVDRK